MSEIILQRLERFRNCFVARVCKDPSQRSRNAFFVFHGFPANRGFRNQDIAEELCWHTGDDVYLFHYAGLGKSAGNFSFEFSVRDSVAFFQAIQAGHAYEKVNIFGHSWGGLVSMNVAVAAGEALQKLVMLAPFNFVAERELSRQVLTKIMSATPIDYAAGGLDGVVEEMERVRQSLNPRDIARRLPWKENQVTIFQSLNDAEVPEFTTREFVKLFPRAVKYEEWVIDHTFLENRERTVERVCQEFLAGSKS